MAQAIVFVTGADPTTGIGGHGTYVRAHARAARRAGFAPHIFCWSARGAIVDTDLGTLHRVQLVSGLDHLPWFRFRTQKMVWRTRLMSRAVAAFAAGLRPPRLIHGFGGMHGRTGVQAARRVRRGGLEVTAIVSAFDTMVREAQAKLRGVSAAHGLLPRLGFAAELLLTRLVVVRFERRGYEGADRILVNYDSVRRELAEQYDVGAKIKKVAYSSETAFLREGGSSRWLADDTTTAAGETPLIVTVSRHDPRKGLDVLIAALARLRAAGVRFRACLLGGGSLLSAHRRLVERIGLAGMVRVEGFVPHAHRYLEEAHVFVQPSLEEGSGSLSVLEALQVGTPVIASGVDGIPEDVVDGKSALLVPPGDPEALAAALRRVLDDQDLCRRLAREGHAVFTARFSADAFTVGLRDAYADLGVKP